MRTTIHLDDTLYRDVKTAAVESGQTITTLIQDALRQRLGRRKRSTGGKRLRPTTWKGKGLRPGVDLNDSASLLERMEHDACSFRTSTFSFTPSGRMRKTTRLIGGGWKRSCLVTSHLPSPTSSSRGFSASSHTHGSSGTRHPSNEPSSSSKRFGGRTTASCSRRGAGTGSFSRDSASKRMRQAT